MIKNSKIEKYLDELGEQYVVNDYSVGMIKMEKVIFPQFFEWDSCILLDQGNKDELPRCFHTNKIISDRTAFEANYNHIHLNDFFDEDIVNPIEIFRVSTMIIEVWASVLKKKFNDNYNFVLVLSFDGEDVVIRFYTKRKDEPSWIDVTNLEGFIDGIMVLEV